MKKISIYLTSLIILCSWGGLAQAAASPYFAHEPSSLGVTWQGVNAAGATSANNWAGDHYSRNVYWDFASSPVGSNPLTSHDAKFFGVIDHETPNSSVLSGDSVSFTGSTAWSSGKVGLKGTSSSAQTTGSAVFTLGNLNLGSNTIPMYYYVEATYTLTGGQNSTNSTITFSLPGTSSSQFFINGTSTGAASTATSYTLSSANTTSGTFDAWFKYNAFPTSEALTISFSGGESNGGGQQGGTAYINSLHIATTPEPMAMALFATGVAVLFFGRRRKAFQLA